MLLHGFIALYATAQLMPQGPLAGGCIANRRSARPGEWFVEAEVDGLDAGTAIAALEQLIPEEREIVVARHWGGLSFEQIGLAAGCSASTAFRRYTAGLEALREKLGVLCPNEASKA